MLHLAEQDGVAEMKVGRGGVEAGFDAQLFAAGEALDELFFGDEFGEAFFEVSELIRHFIQSKAKPVDLSWDEQMGFPEMNRWAFLR